MNLKTFHFNTGVRPFSHTPPAGMAMMKGFKDSGNGVYVIPFQCADVPDEAELDHLSGILEVQPKMIVREILNSLLVSKYAYFKLPENYEQPNLSKDHC